MDKRVEEMLRGGGGGVPFGAPPELPNHPAMLPGVLQVEVFHVRVEDLEKFSERVNAFLLELPARAGVIDRQFVVADGAVTLMLVIKIPTE